MNTKDQNITIDVAKEFSDTPYGRFSADGPFSGERFRNELLIPALDKYELVHIELSGTNKYGSSFLDAAFSGLLDCGFTEEEMNRRISYKHDLLPSIPEAIHSYIKKYSKLKTDKK